MKQKLNITQVNNFVNAKITELSNKTFTGHAAHQDYSDSDKTAEEIVGRQLFSQQCNFLKTILTVNYCSALLTVKQRRK